MSVLTIYRKKDGKKISCDPSQLVLMTKGKDSKYSEKPVDVRVEKPKGIGLKS